MRKMLNKIRLRVRHTTCRLAFLSSSKKDRSVILFGEKGGMEARDNSFLLFSHMYDAGRTDVFFIAHRQCKDKSNLERFGKNIIRYRSLRHFRLIFCSRLMVINDGYKDVYPRIPGILNTTDTPFIYLQHGILMYKKINISSSHYLGRIIRFVISTDFELDIAQNKLMTKDDAEFVRTLNVFRLTNKEGIISSKQDLQGYASHLMNAQIEEVSHEIGYQRDKLVNQVEQAALRTGFPRSRLVQSGLPRHDKIAQKEVTSCDEKYFVIFFTWSDAQKEGELKKTQKNLSDQLNRIFTNRRIIDFVQLHNLKFKLYLHALQRESLDQITDQLPTFVEVEHRKNIGEELGKPLALITDFSSVAYDFALAGTPVVFFHRDKPNYDRTRGDYTQGPDDWIGSITYTEDGLAQEIEKTLSDQDLLSEKKELMAHYPNFGSSTQALVAEINHIPPRVVFIVYNIFGIGGTIKAVTNFANYLFHAGYSVEIISLRRTSENTKMGLHPSIRIYSMQDDTKPKKWIVRKLTKIRSIFIHKDSDLFHRLNLWIDLKLILQVRRCTADFIVPTFPGMVPICNRFRRRKTSVLVMEHKYYDVHKPTIKTLIRKHYPKASAVTVLSDRDFQDQRQFSKRVFKLPNGVVEPDIEMPSAEGNPRIVALGRLHPEKQFELLIQAFSIVSRDFPTWEVHIFGDGEQRGYLQTKINELDLSDKVFLRGSTNEPLKEISLGEICAVPSKSESFGMVIVEAFLAERPVVTFDVETGPREIIVDGVSGYRARPFDVNDYASKLRLLMESPEARRTTGKAARERFETMFSDQAAGRKLESILDILLRGKSNP